MLYTFCNKMMYCRRQKKFQFTVRTTGRAILFLSCLISVQLLFLSIFKPFPFCLKGSSSNLVYGSDAKIIRLVIIALEVSVF